MSTVPKHVDFTGGFVYGDASLLGLEFDGYFQFPIKAVVQPHAGHTVVPTDGEGTLAEEWCTTCDVPVRRLGCDFCANLAVYEVEAEESLGDGAQNMLHCQDCARGAAEHSDDVWVDVHGHDLTRPDGSNLVIMTSQVWRGEYDPDEFVEGHIKMPCWDPPAMSAPGDFFDILEFGVKDGER